MSRLNVDRWATWQFETLADDLLELQNHDFRLKFVVCLKVAVVLCLLVGRLHSCDALRRQAGRGHLRLG